MSDTIGDAAWEDVPRWHDNMLRTQISSHRGRVVHSTGDGFFASFGETGDDVAAPFPAPSRTVGA